jgi:predicted nucleotidyltransferase
LAKTTADAFNEFYEKISLSINQTEQMSARVSIAKNLLQKTFPATDKTPVSTVTLIGSGARGTTVRPLNDIDIFVTFENKGDVFEEYRANSQTFLYRIRDNIDAKTQVANVGARGQAVRLFYNDDLHVDIAPAFKYKGDNGYALPAGDKTWLTTNPFKQIEWAKEREATLSALFARHVKMLKCWNNVHSHRLGSWHLEVMTGTAFVSMGKDSRLTMEKFFGWAIHNISVNDPDGFGGDLAASLSVKQKIELKTSLSETYQKCLKANKAEGAGNHQEAIRLWRTIFGDEFPAFG